MMTESDVSLVVDLREPDEVRMKTLAHPDVDKWLEEQLSAADIVVNGVGIERKTPSDFAGSITEGRMNEQVEKLADAYDHAYLLLEGTFEDFDELGHSSLDPQAMRGMAASLTARHGIPVIPVSNQELLIDHAIRLGRKHTEDPVSSHIPTGPVGSNEPPAKRQWACLPNVGPELAERLYAEIGPVSALTAMEVDAVQRLQEIEGIGETTAQRLYDALWDRDEVEI